MNFRSRKLQSRRQKHSSARSDGKRQKNSSARGDEIEEGEDIISKLPDTVLTQILSFLPEADANRTRILSIRWKNLWAFLPNLRLVMPYCSSVEEANKFHDLVDQTLVLRGGMNIEKFYLYCTKNCDYNRVYDWLCTAVKCKAKKIELRFPADKFRVKFCWDLFRTCNTLVELTLRGEFVLDVPEEQLIFPCLKKINLISIVYSGDESLINLITGCPVLEDLFVERQVIGYSDNLETFMVASPSLKRLRISFALSVYENLKVVIDAPKLEYLYIKDVISVHYTLTKPLSLVEAYIKTQPDVNTRSLVSSLTSVKMLTVTNSFLMARSYSNDLEMPMFLNLVKFVIRLDNRRGWNFLFRLFESMPNLEHITLLDGLVPFPRAQQTYNLHWTRPMAVPNCLSHTMKEIKIVNYEAITEEEFPLIMYLLKYSPHLEKFSLRSHKISRKIRHQLVRFPRGSTSCRIEFF